MKPSKLQFKDATNNDCAVIYDFIVKLANAEQFPFGLTVTMDSLSENLFSSDSIAKSIIAYSNNRPVGFAVYYQTFSTTTGRKGFHLDDLYIEPEYQGRGYGKQTMHYLAKLAESSGCARFEWWALNTNDSAIEFYTKLGAQKLEAISIFRLDESGIKSLITG